MKSSYVVGYIASPRFAVSKQSEGVSDIVLKSWRGVGSIVLLRLGVST